MAEYIIESGEVSSGIILNNSDSMTVLDGGTATITTVNSGGSLLVSSGGTMNGTTVNPSGRLLVFFGGTATDTTVNPGGDLYVSSGGTANSTTVNSGGSLYVFSGGTATDIVWTPCNGLVSVNDGAVVTFVSQYSGVYLGSSNQLLSSAAAMSGVILHSSNTMYVMSGGTADRTIFNSDGTLTVCSGGTADRTMVNGYNGRLIISNGGTANNTTVDAYGRIVISSGGTANDTMVDYNGSMVISRSGMAIGTEIWNRGRMFISSGGTANDTMVLSGGSLDFNGTLTGRLTIQSGAGVSASSDSVLNFDLTQVSAGETSLVNDLSRINGSPLFTLTVPADQANGIYSLADGAENFAGTLTVVGTTEEDFGTLAVGEALEIGGVSYALTLTCGNLSLAVGCEPPEFVVSSGLILTDETKNANAGEIYYDTTISEGGILLVSSGGTASLATVSQGGSLQVSEGGLATRISASKGEILVYSGGVVDDTVLINSGGGSMFVFSGGTATNVNGLNHGSSVFHVGTVADNATVNAIGIIVSSGGTARDITNTIDRIGFIANSVTYGGDSGFNVNCGGTANDIEFIYELHVNSGGTANNITILRGGSLFIHDGGTANDIILNDTLYVSSGGTANNIEINSAYYRTGLRIFSGGTANNIKINSGGSFIVPYYSNDATINDVTVNPGGILSVSGSVTGIRENGGYVIISQRNATFAPNTISGLLLESASATLHSGTTAYGATIISSGKLEVFSGGTAIETTVNSGGSMVISSGGIADQIMVNSLGMLIISSGGIASGVTFAGTNIRILFNIEEGGTAFINHDNPWTDYIYSGGGTVIYQYDAGVYYDGGTDGIQKADYVESLNLKGGREAAVCSGGLLERTTVSSGGSLNVLSGGIADSTTVSSCGNLTVSSGGTANNTTVNRGGNLYISSGGVMNGTTINSGGSLIISSGMINDTTINSCGRFEVHRNGVASDVTVNPGGRLIVSRGGTAQVIRENGGCVDVGPGEKVTFASNTFSGLILRLTYNDSEFATVHSGTTAVSTTIDNAAALIVCGGTANNTTVNRGGRLIVSGGFITGRMSFDSGAVVSMFEGAISVFDFDLTQAEAGGEALVNDLSIIQGTPVYTLTVDADSWKPGTYDYLLAEGASEFNSTISVMNTTGETLETLKIGEKVMIGYNDYTLNLDEGALSLTVDVPDLTAPVITLSADTETVLKQTTLTAEVDDGSELYFRISEFGVWKKYEGPIIASFNETYYFKATDEAGNEGTNQITFGNIDTTGILLSTLWTQKGVCPMGGNTTVCYDEYTPYDPSVTPDTHSLVGCVNVAVGQLVYYFIEKQGLDLALTLKDSDEYKSSHSSDEGDPIVIEIKSDGSTPGTLSFSAINEYLTDFKLDSAEHAAALLYACGVVHKSKYAAASTGTSWRCSIFTRFGFKCVNIDGPYMGMGYYYWGYWDDDFNIHVSDAGYEVLIENLEAGRSVGAAYHGHALVIDGYDRETDTFHINFGWGYNQATRWYTREGMFELQLNDFVYDLMTDYVETFTVTDARLYGTGTMLRAFEQASGMVGANTVVFDSSVAGKTVELENNIKATDETTVNGFNMNVLVTSVYTDEMPAYGFYSDKGGILSFHASGGSLIVSTTNEYTHAFDMSDALSGTVTADNTLIYAGKTSEGADAAAVLQALQTCRSNNTEVSEDLLDSNGWSYFGSSGNDVFSLSDSSIAVGNVTLGDGDDVLTLTGRSRLYGTIDAGDGNDSITIDSTSSISGDLSGKSKLNFVLGELEDHAMFTIKKSVSDLYANATLSVDITDAENGIYTLISAASGAVGIEDLQNMVFTVTGSGAPDFTLSINGTSTSDFADLLYEENSLKLRVKIESATVKPRTQTWEKTEGDTQYIVEYSTDSFEHVIQVAVDSNALDSFQMPAGNYQMRVKPEDGEWTVIEPVVAPEAAAEPRLVKSNGDGNADVFFANSIGTWETGYAAQHVGSTADTWGGTREYATLSGKNKLADIIEGSTDANILLMTDADNGDGLFVDDIYSALPGSVAEQQSRIAQIHEIRAGAGDDIVDMTSHRFEYTGTGLTIRGGAGNDTIWANNGDNWLFGDAGNDRIVGASGNDVIAGGIGNDRMHGGGGSDIFTFGGNWGTDTVEQLAGGSVTLWFASGDESNWNAGTMTYTDGSNSVKVSGVSEVTLRFGDNDSEQYDDLVSAGAFLDSTSERIFEESGKGMLASL